MAFKLFIFAVVIVIVQAGVLPYKGYHHHQHQHHQHHEGSMDAIAETQEYVVRNYDSQSKDMHTPYSMVHKQDTRITKNHNNNNNYDKYSSSGIESNYASYEPNYNYHAHAHEQQQQQQHTTTTTTTTEAPAYYHEASTYHYEAPAYHQEHSTAATPTYHHVPAVNTYNNNDHANLEYGSGTQKVHYSPANMVSHMSFDGFGTHWGF